MTSQYLRILEDFEREHTFEITDKLPVNFRKALDELLIAYEQLAELWEDYGFED